MNKKLVNDVLNKVMLEFTKPKRILEISLTTKNSTLTKKYCSDNYSFQKLRDSCYSINKHGVSMMKSELEINLYEIETVFLNLSTKIINFEFSNKEHKIRFSISLN